MFCKKFSCMLVVARDSEFLLGLAAAVQRSGALRLAVAVSVGSVALRWMAHSAPDVVVLDLALPDMPVLDAIRHMALQHPGTDIVVLSQPGEEAQVLACMQAGASGHLDKSAAMGGLAAYVQRLRAGASTHASMAGHWLYRLAGQRMAGGPAPKPCSTLQRPFPLLAPPRLGRHPGAAMGSLRGS